VKGYVGKVMIVVWCCLQCHALSVTRLLSMSEQRLSSKDFRLYPLLQLSFSVTLRPMTSHHALGRTLLLSTESVRRKTAQKVVVTGQTTSHRTTVTEQWET